MSVSMLVIPSITTLRETRSDSGRRNQRRGFSSALEASTWYMARHRRGGGTELEALGHFGGDAFGEAHHRVAVQQVRVDLGVGGEREPLHPGPDRRHLQRPAVAAQLVDRL